MPSLFTQQAVVLITTAVLHAAGLFLFLQYYFWWYDVMLHFLGGLWVALAFHWYIAMRGQTAGLMVTIGVVLLVGVGWEIFELLVGAPREDNFLFDTTLDLLMDVLGGFIGYLVARITLARAEKK